MHLIFKFTFTAVFLGIWGGVCAAPSTPVAQFVLKNGLTLIVKPDHRAPTAVHMLWVRVGSMDEVDGTSGVAHVVEHMMFKGSRKVKAGDFSRRVAALGGRENAFTTKDYTGYYQQVPSERLKDVMQLESDRFANNQWSDAEFHREIEVVKEERRMRTDDNPHAQLHEVLEAAVFQASSYRRPIVGWMNDLDAMTANDVRAFYRQWYTPGNAAVVVAGDVDVDQVKAWAQATYGRIPMRAVPARKPREEPVQKGMRRVEWKAPAAQGYVSLAFKVPSLTPQSLAALEQGAGSVDSLALAVLAAILDGHAGARLERALTQASDAVADSVSAYYGLTARGPQLFVLSGVPAKGKTSLQVERALRAQIDRIAREGVQDTELQRVKNQWLASEVYQRDSVFNQARSLGVDWVQGYALDSDERVMAQLKKISSAQVQAVAARYFGDDALTVATLLPQPIDGRKTP